MQQAACIGAGVIGAGWAARLALSGIDVNVYDPDSQAGRKLDEVFANARRAYAQLDVKQLPAEGKVRLCSSVEEAVKEATFVQESAPERLDLKQRILAETDQYAPPHALIASSTSGLLPSDMQSALEHPERFLVAHPYNPVYLLPLVELVGGKQTDQSAIARARELYSSLGMKPVVIRKEIDAFVGDRLLESMWREALWLVRDDVATVEELDDIIRYSFGLRFAQMGLFQTYRVAGGEAGMKHFMAQFGPTLQWPWTRLTDVPELNDELIDKISDQSDEQAGGLSIRDLERIRDDNLLAIMHGLKRPEGPWGAGEALAAFEEKLEQDPS